MGLADDQIVLFLSFYPLVSAPHSLFPTARLTEFNSTTNQTLHTDTHFPLDHPLMIDFTHDTTFAQLLPMLNLTSFSASGPPPLDHIPKHRSFISSKFSPFATNAQFQVLKCPSSSMTAVPDKEYIRMILNDGVVPLDGLTGCGKDEKEGKCELGVFVDALRTLVGEVDFQRECQIDLGGKLDEETVIGSPVW